MRRKSLMIQGTASSVGKSLIAAGLCRVFKQDGLRVAPFKSQNMALNSFVTNCGKEMGRAQVVQAEAAGLLPSIEMNPVLLKPTGNSSSQVIIEGKVYGNMSALEYYNYKPKLVKIVRDNYYKLLNKKDIVIIEGAGSPAEINLREKDIVNMGMAKIADSPVVLVGDIDKGGVFASIAGTMLLLEENERKRVKGVIINKFRGDLKILKPGLKMLEDIIKVPVIGVVPYFKFNIDDEDSLTSKFNLCKSDNSKIDIAIIKLPYISNFTDFNVFYNYEKVNLRYVKNRFELLEPDLVIIPGSKNTVNDLIFLKESGLEDEIKRLAGLGKFVFGICGGFQILGNKIKDFKRVESILDEINGLSLLDSETDFEEKKFTEQFNGKIIDESGIFKSLNRESLKGYEIHMGSSSYGSKSIPFVISGERVLGVKNKELNVFGTYIHGIFDNFKFTETLLKHLSDIKGFKNEYKTGFRTYDEFKDNEYNKLADLLRKNLDMEKIYEIINN